MPLAHDPPLNERLEHQLAEAQSLAHIGSWEWDLLTNRISWSDEHYRIYGLEPGSSIDFETASRCVHSHDSPRVQRVIQQCLKDGRPYVVEFRVLRRDGSERTIEARGRLERDTAGRPTRKLGTSQDVTERVRTSDLLQRAEMQYRALVENAVEGVFRTTPDGRFVMANASLARILGYDTPEQLMLERGDLERHHYVDRTERVRFKGLLEAEGLVRGFEYEAYRRDRTTVWLRDHARIVREPDGTTYYEGTVQDITERKRTEQLLDLRARQQAAVARLGESALSGGDVSILLECAASLVADTLSIEFSAVFERRPDGDLLLRAGIGWHEGVVGSIVAGGAGSPAGMALASHRPVVTDDWRVHVDSETAPHREQARGGIRSPITVIIGPSEHPYGVLAAYTSKRHGFTVDDVNFLQGIAAILAAAIVRHRGEEARKHLLARAISAQEEERTRVARELHDETGQALSAILMGLRSLEDVDTSVRTRALAQRLRDLTAQTVRDVGRLARGLRPPLLDHLGLLPALQRYGEELGASHNLAVRITGDRDARFPVNVETTLYRISQEALTNVARHASAQSAEVIIQRDTGVVRVTVRDDGAGFDVTPTLDDAGARRTLGLLGMHERASLLGGKVVIDSRPGAGTTIAVELPVEGTA